MDVKCCVGERVGDSPYHDGFIPLHWIGSCQNIDVVQTIPKTTMLSTDLDAKPRC